MKLILKTNNKTIGVVRNPYHKAIADYYASLNYIGFDKWIHESMPPQQVSLYKNCDYIIRYESWKQDLEELKLHPKDTSILDDVKEIDGWRNWYTLHTRTTIGVLYKEDIITYGYSY